MAETNSCPCLLLPVTGQGAQELKQFASSLRQGFGFCPTYRCPGDLADKDQERPAGRPPGILTHGPIFLRTQQVRKDTCSSSSTDEENQSHEAAG